jgi:hypothetical protein
MKGFYPQITPILQIKEKSVESFDRLTTSLRNLWIEPDYNGKGVGGQWVYNAMRHGVW